MATRHNPSAADELYLGGVYYENYQSGQRGLRAMQLYTHQFGAVVAADADGVLDGGTATATGGTTFTLATGAALVSVAGTAQFDVPRNAVISATGAVTTATGLTFTISGTDVYGASISEAIQGFAGATGGGSSRAGAKAFYTITGASVDGATSEAVNIGTGNVLGLPVKITSKGDIVAFAMDGQAITPTLVAGLATGTTSTTTTADVRGTVTMATGSAPNGTREYTAQIAVPANKRKIDVFGNAQA